MVLLDGKPARLELVAGKVLQILNGKQLSSHRRMRNILAEGIIKSRSETLPSLLY